MVRIARLVGSELKSPTARVRSALLPLPLLLPPEVAAALVLRMNSLICRACAARCCAYSSATPAAWSA